MANRNRDSQYVRSWHFDCRLSKELPDDNPIRGRFLLSLFACTVAAIAIFYATITLYSNAILRRDIAYWEQLKLTNSPQMAELQKVTNSIQSGARRLNDINKLITTPLPVSDFIQEVGRSRPANLRIDMVEFHDGTAFIRGGLRETPKHASDLLSQYVSELRSNPRVRPLFNTILLSSMEPNPQTGTMSFEISLKIKAATP